MKSRLMALALVASLSLVACGGDENVSDTYGNVRVLVASPNAPGLDLEFGDNQVAADLSYMENTGYLIVPPGSLDIRLEPLADTAAVLKQTLNIAEQGEYTVIALNYVDELESIVLEDDDVAPPSGQVRLRVVHGAPALGPVDVYVTLLNDPLESPVLTNVAFKDASAYLNLPAGTYRVSVTLTGSDEVIYTSFVTGLAGLVATAIVYQEPDEVTDLGIMYMVDDRF
jgi:hypothetical protein